MDYAARLGMFHTILDEIDEGFHCPLQIPQKFNTAIFWNFNSNMIFPQ